MVQSFDTVAPSFSCSSCRNCCVFSFLSAMLRPWKSRASSANWSNWRWFLITGRTYEVPKVRDLIFWRILCVKGWYQQKSQRMKICETNMVGWPTHFQSPKSMSWSIEMRPKNTLGRWQTRLESLQVYIMIPQMMGIGKLTGLKYRPGPIRPPTPEVKGTSLRPPIRPRCATSPGFQVQGLGGPKAVSWVGPPSQ